MLQSILTLVTDVEVQVLKHEDSGARGLTKMRSFWREKIEQGVIYDLCSNTINRSSMFNSVEDS